MVPRLVRMPICLLPLWPPGDISIPHPPIIVCKWREVIHLLIHIQMSSGVQQQRYGTLAAPLLFKLCAMREVSGTVLGPLTPLVGHQSPVYSGSVVRVPPHPERQFLVMSCGFSSSIRYCHPIRHECITEHCVSPLRQRLSYMVGALSLLITQFIYKQQIKTWNKPRSDLIPFKIKPKFDYPVKEWLIHRPNAFSMGTKDVILMSYLTTSVKGPKPNRCFHSGHIQCCSAHSKT